MYVRTLVIHNEAQAQSESNGKSDACDFCSLIES